MKIYIAGKITGDHDYKAKFEKAADAITQFGHTPINPATAPEGLTAQDYMRLSFAEIDAADMVVFLKDWTDSKGASLERAYCEYIKKPFMSLKDFINDNCKDCKDCDFPLCRECVAYEYNLMEYENNAVD